MCCPGLNLLRPVGRTWLESGGPARPAGRMRSVRGRMWLERSNQVHGRGQVEPGRNSVLPGRRRIGRRGLAVERGSLAGTVLLDSEMPLPDELAQGAIEKGAIRLIAEHLTHLAPGERLGKAPEQRGDVLLHLGGAPPPGPLR